ncbi:MAG: restriction endonuclease subunit S [Deltaproteobacteria bacterium HGW-Deltaproteobacteria-12]|jgi:type I restriction enzyme S subunit|nr:MAG: restriction endonuclease subunit S [Deltaproteobacteria bacterium HGW-Deltaproteobacteria-12]
MIADLQPYKEYKESGSRWLGNVPSHWGVHNLRTLIRRRNERHRTDLSLLSVAREKGVFVRSLTDDSENHNVIPEDLSNYKVARAGNLVINKMKAWQGSMGIAPCDGIVSPAYYVFDFDIAHRSFGQVLLRSKPYVAHFAQASDGVRIGQWDLTIAGMRQIPVLVPKEEEQTAIVRFLNWTNNRLGRAVKAKQKQIALLNEQKQAIINRAVTRGLNPSVPLKPSGIPWVGDIPKHWKMRKLRQILTRVTERNRPDLPLLSVVREKGVIKRDTENFEENHNYIPADLSNYKIVKAGQFAMNKMKAWQGSYGLSEFDGIVSPAYFVFSLSGVNGDFFHTALRSRAYVPFFTQASDGVRVGQWDLAEARMKEIPFFFPSSGEQIDVVKFVNDATAEITSAISRLKTEIALLLEYRTRLVSDVVTGKLDVREAAAKLPEEEIEEITEASEDMESADEEIAV